MRAPLSGCNASSSIRPHATAARSTSGKFSPRKTIENILDDARKIAVKTLFDFLRAEADRLQHFAAAQRTLRRNRPAQSAVVTDEKSGAPMHRHRHAAIAAAKFVSAFAAQQIRCIT